MAWRHLGLVLAMLLAACSPVFETAPRAPPPPAPTATPRPATPEEVASAYLAAWQQGDFGRMYDMLSSTAQTATARELFIRRHTNIRDGIDETHLTARATVPAQPNAEGVQ